MINKNKIKVLIIPSWYPPDGGGFFRDHAEAVNNEEFEVHVLVTRFLSITKNSLSRLLGSIKKRSETEGGVYVQRQGFIKIPLLTKQSLLLWKQVYVRQINKYIAEFGKPDILIVHSAMWAGIVARVISLKHKIPFILVEHRSLLVTGQHITAPVLKSWQVAWLRDVYQSSDKIVPVSNSLIETIRTIAPGVEERITVIPNMIGPLFMPEFAGNKKRNVFVYISFGILEKRKGFRYLLEAFKMIIDNFEGNFQLRIGGRGSEAESLQKYAGQLKISDKVFFLGRVPRELVRKEMEGANVFVLPSLSESFGVVLIEAMATGLPVISTRSGGPEFIINSSNGLLVDPGNSVELYNAMSEIYLGYKKYDSKRIRFEVLEKFGPEKIALKYHQLIKSLLNEQNRTKK